MPASDLLRPPGGPARIYPRDRVVRPRRERLLQHLSQSGLTLGLAMLWVALSPSLLPRTWWMTAVAVGVSVFLGYVAGSLLGRLLALVARLMDLQVSVNARSDRVLRVGWDAVLILVSVWVWWWSVREQAANAALVGLESGGNAAMAAWGWPSSSSSSSAAWCWPGAG